MDDYWLAVQELDIRWSFALRFVPNHSKAEESLFQGLVRQMARERRLNLFTLMDAYEEFLVHGACAASALED